MKQHNPKVSELIFNGKVVKLKLNIQGVVHAFQCLFGGILFILSDYLENKNASFPN